MPEFRPPTFGDDEKKEAEPSRLSAWLAARFVRKWTGAPAEIVTTEKMADCMKAWGHVLDFLKWMVDEWRKKRDNASP